MYSFGIRLVTAALPFKWVFFLHFQSELPYATWQEVQARIVEIQKEHQICIHKKELTELDIYHRILRFKNYMVRCVFAQPFTSVVDTCKPTETMH